MSQPPYDCAAYRSTGRHPLQAPVRRPFAACVEIWQADPPASEAFPGFTTLKPAAASHAADGDVAETVFRDI